MLRSTWKIRQNHPTAPASRHSLLASSSGSLGGLGLSLATINNGRPVGATADLDTIYIQIPKAQTALRKA